MGKQAGFSKLLQALRKGPVRFAVLFAIIVALIFWVNSLVEPTRFMERYIESYVAEMEAFVGCILQDSDPPVGGFDGRMPVMLGMAARKSYEQNRPVALSEIA